MNRKWILAAAMAFGTAGAIAPMSYAKDKPESKREREREFDESVSFRDLPKPVQETVDKEAHGDKVKSFWHVQRDGKEFYRAIIDTKGNDTVLRIKPGGALITEGEIKDDSGAHRRVGTGTATGSKRQIRLHTDETDGDEVDFDRLPGAVKSRIGALAKGDKIEEVIRYKHRGNTMYRAEVGTGKYTRFIRVGEGGELDRVTGDIDPGEKVPFDRLPGAVKSKIGSLAKSGKVDEVIEYKRGGKTYYQAEVDERGGNRTFFYTVDDSGREVEGLPRV